MTSAEWKVLLILALIPAFFIIVYHYYYFYKVLTAKCQVCGRGIAGQWGRKIGFVYTPWRKIRFTCEDCQKKKKKNTKNLTKLKSTLSHKKSSFCGWGYSNNWVLSNWIIRLFSYFIWFDYKAALEEKK